MNYKFPDEQSQSLFEASVVFLREKKGSILSFSTFSRNFSDYTKAQLSSNIEFLASKQCGLLKKVFFFVDEQDGLHELPDDSVGHYLKGGEIYHPVNNTVIDEPLEHIVIEFKVL